MNSKLYELPSTDDEAREALRADRHPLIGADLVDIFDVRRMQGDTLLKAYEVALKAHLQAAGIMDADGNLLKVATDV